MSTNLDSPVRSPSYPVMSLADAIAAVHKIEGQYRSSKVDREIAAEMIGYSSLSGPANKALAALAQYGLVERAGKGEMRVTDRARAILHPDNAGEKRRELEAAALEPALFRELKERWPDVMPPEQAVISYFNRRGFNPSAIRPAARAYLQTLLYLEEEGANDSHGTESPAGTSPVADEPREHIMETLTPTSVPRTAVLATAYPVAYASGEAAEALNKINMNIRGDKVHLEALLDHGGLIALEKKIAALKVLLEVPNVALEAGESEDGE